jgi:tetratricopeptide (TPR) repeat protein
LRHPFLHKLLALSILPVTLAACARALREPPPLQELGGGGPPASPAAVDGLLAKAELLYATRIPDDVRHAGDLWIQAARADSSRIEGLVGAARAHAWLADHGEDPEMRLRAAERAVHAGQWCLRIAPEAAACSYWLGAGLGLQARERRSTAMDALPRIVELFRRAASAEPSLEKGSPDRALALLYARAPGWPTGPGDPELALDHARKAVALEPDHPPNQLALAEALAATDEEEGSRAAYELALDLARAAASRGEPDALDWIREAEKALSSGDGA